MHLLTTAAATLAALVALSVPAAADTAASRETIAAFFRGRAQAAEVHAAAITDAPLARAFRSALAAPSASARVSAWDCGEAFHRDPADVRRLDGTEYGVLSCGERGESVVALAVLTRDVWVDAELDAWMTVFDDGRPTTGCDGIDGYLVVTYADASASLKGGVVETPDCDERTWSVTDGLVDRGGYDDFLMLAVPGNALGTADSFFYGSSLTAWGYGEIDFLPDSGMHQAARFVGSGGTLPPGTGPASGPRGTEDACPGERVPAAGFLDVAASNVHAANIDCVAWWQVAKGVSSTSYRGEQTVTRAQMATFIARLVEASRRGLPQQVPDLFVDDTASVHQHNINRLAGVGIVGGYGGGLYRPDQVVSREQMATFLVRAYEYVNGAPLGLHHDYFGDDTGSAHEANINKAAAVGVTGGTAPGMYNPAGAVRRDQMASFLARVLDLAVVAGHTEPPR